jgi:UDP-N-acetylglucosamine acyltransferase
VSRANVHPTAIVDSTVQLDPTCEVGPFAVIKGHAIIGPRTKIHNHVTIGSEFGDVTIGADNQIMPGAVVGGIPQDVSYKNERTKLVIGNKNIIREFVTINLGTLKECGVTEIGNDCMLMAYVHVGHDCKIGNNVIIANSTNLAGHVAIDDFARVGGMCGISQFCHIGRFAYLAGDSAVNKDILPFSMAQGNFAVCRATNKIGMERAGFAEEEISSVHKAIRALLMGDRTLEEAIEKIKSDVTMTDSVKHLLSFVEKSKNGIAR